MRLFLSACVLFVMSYSQVAASQEFDTAFSAVYDIGSDGTATVTQNIKLTNKLSNVYATQYALEIGSTRLENVFAFDNAGNKIDFIQTVTDNKTVIGVTFENKVVGKGQTLDFTVRYKNLDVSQKTGRILEVNIPKVSPESQIDHYEVTINVPQTFGAPKIVTPNTYQTSTIGKKTSLIFNAGEIMQQGITAIFGEVQAYDFTLTYNLENPTVTNAITQVALPPDTPYQKVFYHSFSKLPQKIVEDEDDNWIATYELEPKERVSVLVTGTATIYMDPIIITPPVNQKTLDQYLKPQKYWDTTNKEIIALAKDLNTPEKIYDYLVNTFSYNYDRINSGIGRLGAVDAIKHPDNAICTEFTDAFVTIARAAGIPAREVNGYAHTENSVLKPLSLIQDVLHSWAEYYDATENRWKPVDPTWGNTTGGVDYFSHLDFNHFTFAFHGLSSERPYPAGYYKFDGSQSKDLQITFASDMPIPQKKFAVHFNQHAFNLLSREETVTVTIKNESNQAVYQLPISFSASGANLLSQTQVVIDSFLPLGEYESTVKLNPTTTQSTLRVTIEDNDYEFTLKPNQAIQNIPFIAGSIAVGAVIAFIAYRTWRVLVSKPRK